MPEETHPVQFHSRRDSTRNYATKHSISPLLTHINNFIVICIVFKYSSCFKDAPCVQLTIQSRYFMTLLFIQMGNIMYLKPQCIQMDNTFVPTLFCNLNRVNSLIADSWICNNHLNNLKSSCLNVLYSDTNVNDHE